MINERKMKFPVIMILIRVPAQMGAMMEDKKGARIICKRPGSPELSVMRFLSSF
jgi:hypothetical protein